MLRDRVQTRLLDQYSYAVSAVSLPQDVREAPRARLGIRSLVHGTLRTGAALAIRAFGIQVSSPVPEWKAVPIRFANAVLEP